MHPDELSALHELLKLARLRNFRKRKQAFAPLIPRILFDTPAKLPRGLEIPESVTETDEWKALIAREFVKVAPAPAGRWMITKKGESIFSNLCAELFPQSEESA